MKRPVVITLLVMAMAFVCLGIGAVIFFTANGGFPTNNPFDQRNISSQLEESKTLKVDAEKPLTLNVATAAGSVTVTGANVETVQVKVVKTAFDSSQARADEEVKGIKYNIEQSGNTITLEYELPKSMNFSNNVNTVDFIVTVPMKTKVDVDTSLGDVSVEDIEGAVVVQNDFGAARVLNITGTVSVSSNGGTVTGTSIKAATGDIDLHSDFGSITLEKASGGDITLDTNSGAIDLNEVRATRDLMAHTQFGDVAFENGSADSLSVETNSGSVSLVNLTVNQEIKVQDAFGNIKLNQAFASSYHLHTNSGAITVDGAEGKLIAHTDFGGITVENGEAVTLDLKSSSGSVNFIGSLGDGPHTVISEFGQIELTLPTDSKLDVDLKTDFGGISSDLPITMVINGSSNSNEEQIVGSINGGGAQLTVQTNSGSVNIHTSK